MKAATTRALDFFLPNRDIARIAPLGRGKINDTWLVRLCSGRQLVLQRLSAAVFSDPLAVMANLRAVLAHLEPSREQLLAAGVSFFQLRSSPGGTDFLLDEEGHCWRLLSAIHPSTTLEGLRTPEQAEGIGAMLGRFHLLLADMDQQLLSDPLPGFHDTAGYLQAYDRLMAAGAPAAENRDQGESLCHRFIAEQRGLVPLFQQQQPQLSRGLTHGDPKVSNFLFSPDQRRVISLIDLDTVRPGLLLHDLGDCLRSCCNPLGENHQQPEKTRFAGDIYAAVLRGYSRVGRRLLTATDLQLLPQAVRLICFELGLRFFSDHLQGDRYFKTSSRGQNLERALIQFHLADAAARQEPELESLSPF
ncbi:phosphotransferase enzyme family protein [Desulfogranum mediterraneum]|uniref:phosphotransferase enzyme family protein n=1 Tax=Desulfogranum mediterraneum TaxID=160661 RepID=UPI00040C7FC7|nr:aminoglycoside phosphotransferase family protein [Desulfogranum mediterraneum]